MSKLEKIIEENMKIINRQLKEILDRIDKINCSFKATETVMRDTLAAMEEK